MFLADTNIGKNVYVCIAIDDDCPINWGLDQFQLLSLNWLKEINLSSYFVLCVLNCVFLSLPFIVFRLQYKYSTLCRLIFLSLFSTSLEFVLIQWEFAFPYFNNGYLLCFFNEIIQWYKITGILGGTLWICLVNGLLYFVIFHDDKLNTKRVTLLIAIILIPIIYSLIDFKHNIYNDNITKDFVALHPNTSCYNHKYNIPPDSLTEYYISISKKEIDDFTELLIWPETALTEYINLDSIDNSSTYIMIKNNLLDEYKNLTLISGGFIDTISYLSNNKPRTENEKFLYQIHRKRKRFNTAFYFNNGGEIKT